MIRHELDAFLPDAVLRAKEGKCEGSCDQHEGLVKAVRVRYIATDVDWGYFAYCQVARDEDVSRGMELTEVKP